MSKHTPWTDEEAEKASSNHDSKYYLEDIANGKGTLEEVEDAVHEAFLAGVAWAAAQIEKCETVTHGLEDGELSFGDTHEAKLVGVREVNHE